MQFRIFFVLLRQFSMKNEYEKDILSSGSGIAYSGINF